MKRIIFSILTIIFLSLFLCSCNSSKTHSKTYYTFFDTVCSLTSYNKETDEQFETVAKQVENILDYYNRLLDIYHKYTSINNLCSVNENAGIKPVEVDSALLDFIDYAKYIHNLTRGKTDISMGSVLSLWHSARVSEDHRVPSEKELTEASCFIGFDNIETDRSKNTVFLKKRNSSIDAGAIGKGYACEKASEFLRSKNLCGYVLDIGGNISVIGTKPDGKDWIVGIKNPQDTEILALKILVCDKSVSTSGSYERYFISDGIKYSHIIDSQTLYMPSYFESVSVVCKNSALADSLSTALFCMNYEQGRALAESLEGVDCIWITKDGEVKYTKGIKPC